MNITSASREGSNNGNAAIPATPTKIVPPLPNSRLIVQNIQVDYPPAFPMVAIQKSASIVDAYDLFITVVIPTGSINITLDTNFTDTADVPTEVGALPLKVREITIDYDTPNNENSNSGSDVYLITCSYQVGTQDQAQAVYVHYTFNDPVTTRGTITTVMTT